MHSYRAHISLAAGLICGVFAATQAHADNWNVTSALEVGGAFTDNAFLAGDNETRYSDFLITVTPSGTVRGAGARVSANLDASLSRSHSMTLTRGDKTNVNLLGNGRAEWVEDFAFFDAQLSVKDHSTKPDLPSSPSSSGARSNWTTVYAMNLSQSFRHRFSDIADSSLVLRYSPVLVSSTEITDTHTLMGQFSLASGRWFRRFQWGLDLSQSRTTRENSLPDLERRTANSNYKLLLGRSVSAIGSVGYEKIEDETLKDQPVGLIWKAGLEIKPGRRTYLRAAYGDRYGDELFDFEGRYEYSPRTSIRATFDQSIETSQTSIGTGLRYLGIDADGISVDMRTGLPFDSDSEFGLENVAFRVKRFQATAKIGGRRGTVTLRGIWESHDSDVEIFKDDANADQIVTGGNLGYTRALSRRTDGVVNIGYRRTEFDNAAQRIDDRYNFAATVTYKVAKNVNLLGGYGYVLRDSSEVGTGYRENSGFIRFVRKF